MRKSGLLYVAGMGLQRREEMKIIIASACLMLGGCATPRYQDNSYLEHRITYMAMVCNTKLTFVEYEDLIEGLNSLREMNETKRGKKK